jgi:hypothetical protein
VGGKPIFHEVQASLGTGARHVDGGVTDAREGDPDILGHKDWRRLAEPRKPVDDAAIRESAHMNDEEEKRLRRIIRKEAHAEDAGHSVDAGILRGERLEWERDHPPVDDRVIEHSAERGLTRGKGFDAEKPHKEEIAAYKALADTLAAMFEKGLGKQMMGVGHHYS